MKTVIITGTNGMIGRLILENCLLHQNINKVISITRKPLGIKHHKLIEIIHHNFLDFSTIEDQLKNIDIVYYCLGVYTGQVSSNEFKEITVHYTQSFAKTIQQLNPNCSFCFLSGAGADSSEKSTILFAREKGIAENILLQLQFKATYIFRPGYIYPTTPRKEPNIFYALMRKLYKPLAFIYPNIGISSTDLANKIFTVGLNGGTNTIYENRDIKNETHPIKVK